MPRGVALVSVAAAALVSAAVAAAALGLTAAAPPLRMADEAVTDLMLGWFAPPEPQHSGIALITLGDDSFAGNACRSPVDRSLLAGLLERLEGIGVRAIGLDVLLDEPTVPEADRRLSQRMRDAAVPVVAVTALEETPLSERQRRFLNGFLDGVPQGFANLAKDGLDGVVRWHVPAGPDGQPSFPARLAAVVGGRAPPSPFRISWRAGPDAATPPFPTYPAEAVAMLPRRWLEGRVVLIGTDLAGADRHRTAVSRGAGMAGVAIQAHVLAQILDGRSSPRLGFGMEAALVAVLAGLGVLLARTGLGLRALVPLGFTGLAALWAGGIALFAEGGPAVPLVAPSIAWLGGLGIEAVRLGVRERADRRLLMELFANHVSQPIAEDIWSRRDIFLAGGRPRPQELTATVLFSDIEGFTTVCESLPPEPLLAWLEGYLDAMVRIVGAHDGIVLRFIGDAVLAVFGVPIARTTEAEIDADAGRAVRCAIEMGRELEALNRRWQAEGLPPVRIRVGIQTGPLVAGSLGGLRHREYSLLGDTANTAARLESFAKEVGRRSSPWCRIVIGDRTRAAVAATQATEPVGELMLRGKRKAVGAWLVRDDAGRITPLPIGEE